MKGFTEDVVYLEAFIIAHNMLSTLACFSLHLANAKRPLGKLNTHQEMKF